MNHRTQKPINMYLGNLFMIENGIGKISDIKYVVIKKRMKYVAYPGEFKVRVGSYEVTKEDNNIPYLINATRLDEITGKKPLTSKQVLDVIIQNNDPKQLKRLYNRK